jgi:hypothetical protein
VLLGFGTLAVPSLALYLWFKAGGYVGVKG